MAVKGSKALSESKTTEKKTLHSLIHYTNIYCVLLMHQVLKDMTGIETSAGKICNQKQLQLTDSGIIITTAL